MALAWRILALNTAAFTVCFAVWMMYGVLVTFLVDRGLYAWTREEMGWLIGVPVLTGSLLRLPVGVLADRYGGRLVFALLMLGAALPTWSVSLADSFWQFLLAGLGFGLCGTSFAVGVAYTAAWFPPTRQGTALGIFGIGNIGAALTSMGAPLLLNHLTGGGADLEGWRGLPRLYAAALVLTSLVFWVLTETRRVESRPGLAERLAPLRDLRVWRFGLYYFFAFGGFVALSQWLIPYYVNMYGLPLASAGFLVGIFSLPAGGVRALGGWLADRMGARSVMYGALGSGLLLLVLLFPPRMEIQTPGPGITAARAGVVSRVSEREIAVGADRYPLREGRGSPRLPLTAPEGQKEGQLFLPVASFRQEPVVKAGEGVAKGQLLARGVTHIYFQANLGVFTSLVFLLGIALGCTSAAVYKHIPHYFPANVGVVGGLVGVLGGLGGFVDPIVFGYLLQATGLWTTCWMYLFLVGLGSLLWMHLVIQHMMHQQVPALMREIEAHPTVLCPRYGSAARIRLRVESCSLWEGEGPPECGAPCLRVSPDGSAREAGKGAAQSQT
ncbi:MAG TPA: MFS transporter [Candidatus Nitrosotenuis sp.]|nr:MFS transporter [Candidatus Nitrosotenuis sp.]